MIDTAENRSITFPLLNLLKAIEPPLRQLGQQVEQKLPLFLVMVVLGQHLALNLEAFSTGSWARDSAYGSVFVSSYGSALASKDTAS